MHLVTVTKLIILHWIELPQRPTPTLHTEENKGSKRFAALFFSPYIHLHFRLLQHSSSIHLSLRISIHFLFFYSLPFSSILHGFSLYFRSMCSFFFVSSPTLFTFIDWFLQPFTSSSSPPLLSTALLITFISNQSFQFFFHQNLSFSPISCEWQSLYHLYSSLSVTSQLFIPLVTGFSIYHILF